MNPAVSQHTAVTEAPGQSTNYPSHVDPTHVNPWQTEPRHANSGCCSEQNVGAGERAVSMLGGACLAAYGLSGGHRGSLLALLAGAGLIYRGATGHCSGYSMLGVSTA